MPFEASIDIDRPPATVFAFLADGRNATRWYQAVRHAEPITPGAPAAGTRYRFVRELPGGRAENIVALSEFQPNERLTLTSLEGPTPFTYRYALQPHGAGTRLFLDGEISGAGLQGPAALLAPLAPHLFSRGMHDNLRRLKGILELT